MMFDALKKYAVFSGRARRKEYWLFFLFYTIVMIVVTFIDVVMFDSGVLIVLFLLGFSLPLIAVQVRRLHDSDKRGWWALMSIVPIANLILLVFFCMDGTHGANRFGPDPKASDR